MNSGSAIYIGGATSLGSHNQKQVISILIQKLVKDNIPSVLDVSPSPHSQRNLQKYLEEPETVDLVYEKVIERAQDKSNKVILVGCIRLLKRHLGTFVPKKETLINLDHFLSSIFEHETTEVKSSVKYLRALIASKMPQGAKPPEIHSPRSISSASKQNTNDVRLSSSPTHSVQTDFLPFNSLHKVTRVKKLTTSDSSVPITMATDKKESETYEVQNFLCLRIQPASAKISNASRPSHKVHVLHPLHSLSLALNESISLKMTNIEKTNQRINLVAKAKKREETKEYKESGRLTVRRKGVQLFQYKYYMDQDALKLDDETLETVIDTVVNPPQKDHEASLMASKILIKILIDSYCEGDYKNAGQLLLKIIKDMFSTGRMDTKIHAFNLIFNLSIHCNMLAEASFCSEDQNLRNSHQAEINEAQTHLFEMLKSALMLLLDKNEKEEKLWLTAFNCLLFFVSHRGKLDKRKLISLDGRLVAAFVERLLRSCIDTLQRKLIQMLIHVLYQNNNSFDLEVLNRCCGINFILGLYTRVTSVEGANNLFVVIYDHVVNRVFNGKKLDESQLFQSSLLLDVFRRESIPLILRNVFKFIPKRLLKSLTRLIRIDQLVKESIYEKDFILKVLRGIKKLAVNYLELDSEYKQHLLNIQNNTDGKNTSVETLYHLFFTPHPEHLQQGIAFLFALVQTAHDDPKSSVSPLVESTLAKILSSSFPEVRQVYLLVTEKLLLYLLNKNERTPFDVIQSLSDKLMTLVSQGEKDETNLLLAFDIILNFISPSPEVIPKTPYESVGVYGDTATTLVLEGYATISTELLAKVNLELLKYLFEHIVRRKTRTVLLLLLIEKYKQGTQPLSASGVAFFRSLLMNRDPEIAYHASRVLIDQLQKEKPEQYRAILSRLVNRAQQTNDEHLLDNSYLQIKCLLEGI